MRHRPDRWVLIRKEYPVVGIEEVRVRAHTCTHTISSSLSYCSKHIHQSGGCPQRRKACLTSLIGFFSSRSQGDEKLYQAEIINFALNTRNSLTLHFSQKMKWGGLLFSTLLFLDSIPLLGSLFSHTEETY